MTTGETVAYQAASLAVLADWLTSAAEDEQWRLVLEFLNEYWNEPVPDRPKLLVDEPPTTGDRRWDVFLAALAEHLAYEAGDEAPGWSQPRILDRFWFPFNTPAARVDAFVHAPAAFRRRGVFVADRDLEVV